jgi:hypothetical protein
MLGLFCSPEWYVAPSILIVGALCFIFFLDYIVTVSSWLGIS